MGMMAVRVCKRCGDGMLYTGSRVPTHIRGYSQKAKCMSETTAIAPTLESLRARREDILAVAEQYGAYNLRVFGSVARGDAVPGSDIDLLVSFRSGTSLYELSGFLQDIQELLGQSVDIVEDHPGLRERFRQRIMKDAVPL